MDSLLYDSNFLTNRCHSFIKELSEQKYLKQRQSPTKFHFRLVQDERSFLKGQTYYLERGITKGISTTIQLQQAPPSVTKTGATSSD
jgi:hypothetical protein